MNPSEWLTRVRLNGACRKSSDCSSQVPVHGIARSRKLTVEIFEIWTICTGNAGVPPRSVGVRNRFNASEARRVVTLLRRLRCGFSEETVRFIATFRLCLVFVVVVGAARRCG